VSASERIALHTINRATGHRVRRVFVDSETGKPVAKEDQVKGYEIGPGDHVVLQPDEVAAAVPESDKTLSVSAFVRCSDVDDVYFDRSYYLSPADRSSEEAFALIREGLRKKEVVAIASAVLFRRVRSVLIRAHPAGLIATTLNFDYEVRSAQDVFDAIPEIKIEGEMLKLAEHIIGTKAGTFDESAFDDRYEAALADLVRAKLEGKKVAIRRKAERGPVVDLMAALRESAGLAGGKPQTQSNVKRNSPSGERPARSRRKAS
jgi:DNA end-binding protein Ku